MITNIKKILADRGAFSEYRNKLDYVAGVVLPQYGEPVRFPCLAVTVLNDNQINNPAWKHGFIYSQMEDLLALLDKVDDGSLERIAAHQALKYGTPLGVSVKTVLSERTETIAAKVVAAESKPSEWDEFWDKMEEATPPEGCRSHVEPDDEEKDFLLVRETIKNRNPDVLYKAANWFLRRWPGTLFRPAILNWMKLAEHDGTLSNDYRCDKCHMYMSRGSDAEKNHNKFCSDIKSGHRSSSASTVDTTLPTQASVGTSTTYHETSKREVKFASEE